MHQIRPSASGCGSVIAVTNASGSAIAINSYDEYGIPASANMGRFQYSRGTRLPGGQASPETLAWLPELGMYYYKARMYSPTLGRFMQTDPIGYADGINWYNYVGSDPINATDPSGLLCTGTRICPDSNRNGGSAGAIVTVFGGDSGSNAGAFERQKGGSNGTIYHYGTSPDNILWSIFIGDDWSSGSNGLSALGANSSSAQLAPQSEILVTTRRATRSIYRWFVPDPCSGQGTNEGAGVPVGYDPYDVDEKGSLAAYYGHVLPDHDFGSSASVLPMILSAIQTNPAKGSGGSLVYIINTGQYVGFDAKHQAGSDYITVIMGPNINGSRTLRTAYPGCR